MNLITDKWIDVVREDGTYDTIAPHQIVEKENPPVDFDGGLPSIDGGYILFLIHLFQTVVSPEDEQDWLAQFDSPPSPEALEEKLAEVAYAFDVDGDGFRYMQAGPDSKQKKSLLKKLSDKKKGAPNGLPLLLCGSASANKMNQTIFGVKNLDPDPIPVGDAAAMLTWVMASGKTNAFGQSGSTLRKNGCVNAVVMGSNLWETVWANVMPFPDFYEYVTGRDYEDAEIDGIDEFEFPWMQEDFNPRDVHHGRQGFNPLSMLWFMPSWNWLDITSDGKVADVIGNSTGKGNAKDGWKHPLSGWDPGRTEPNPMRLSKDLDVDSWVKIRFPKSDKKPANMPKVMERVIYERSVPASIKETDQVWILATVVEGIANATHNVNDRVPLMLCSGGVNDDLAEFARRLKAYAGQAIKEWDKAVRQANMSKGKDVFFKNKVKLWSNLEAQYFAHLKDYRQHLEASKGGSDKKMEELLSSWANLVDTCVLEAFDTHLVVDKFAVTTYKYDRDSPKKLTSSVVEKSWLEYNLYKLKEDVL